MESAFVAATDRLTQSVSPSALNDTRIRHFPLSKSKSYEFICSFFMQTAEIILALQNVTTAQNTIRSSRVAPAVTPVRPGR